MKEVYCLFTSDLNISKSSQRLYGVFETNADAVSAAKENNLFTSTQEVIIRPVKLNEFKPNQVF